MYRVVKINLKFLHKGEIMIKNMLQEHIETDQQKREFKKGWTEQDWVDSFVVVAISNREPWYEFQSYV